MNPLGKTSIMSVAVMLITYGINSPDSTTEGMIIRVVCLMLGVILIQTKYVNTAKEGHNNVKPAESGRTGGSGGSGADIHDNPGPASGEAM